MMANESRLLAHSENSAGKPQTLEDHLLSVAGIAKRFARPLGPPKNLLFGGLAAEARVCLNLVESLQAIAVIDLKRIALGGGSYGS